MNKPITLCDRCDIYMSCLLDYDGIPCRKNRTVQPTNADRVRAKTDEELEEWYWWMHKEMMYYTDSYAFVHNWLKQEIEEK